MKNFILHINLILLFAGIVVSCSNEQQSILDIKHTEALLETHPDSALGMLKKIDPKTLSTSEYARYCLLMTEALGKNQIPITSDSLISVAVEYFNDKSAKDIKAKTYFYAGWVNQEMQNAKQAMEYFLKAADFAEDGKDYKLQFLIYYYLGDLYFQENLYDSALRMNKQAFKYSKLLGNKSYMVYALRNTALAYSGKGRNDSSIIYYSKAIGLLPKSDSVTLATLLNEIGGKYNLKGDYSRAIQCVNKAISMNPPYSELLYSYITKAHTYFNSSQCDSAYYYYNKTKESSNLNTKAESLYKLSNIERMRGNILKALDYNNAYLQCRDSIEKQSRSEMIIKMQNIYQHKKTVEKIQYLTLEKNQQRTFIYLISAISVSVLLLLITILLLYRSRKERQTRELELTVQKEKEEVQIAKTRLQESELIRVRKEKTLLEKEMELRTDFFNRLNNLTFPFLASVEQKNANIRLTEEDWDSIVKNTDAAFNHFSVRLAKAYPELKREEILFCCLIKMKLGLTTLSSVYSLSKDAISKRKERIKKNKMKIEDGRSLDQFLSDF